MFVFLMILIAGYLIYLFLENEINRRAIASFRYVIHVNGIRGKTSTCRSIDAALRTRYRVFTKTTGTDAAYIGTDGIEHPVRRLGPANIHEQIRTIRKARREGAEILILECMAVRPELQKIAQERIVQSKISVITNVRYDHAFEMGDTLPEIADSLGAVIPDHGILISADPNAAEYWGGKCRLLGTKLITCPSTDTAAENAGIALAIADLLGVPEAEAREGLKHIQQDFGIRRRYNLEEFAPKRYVENPSSSVVSPGSHGASFLNLFSANDPQSTESNLADELSALCNENMEKQPDAVTPFDCENSTGANADSASGSIPAAKASADIVFLYNHRPDRPDRAILFAKHFVPLHREARWLISGKGASLAARLFRSAGAENITILGEHTLTPEALLSLAKPAQAKPAHMNLLIVGIGNIKGPAYGLINSLERRHS